MTKLTSGGLIGDREVISGCEMDYDAIVSKNNTIVFSIEAKVSFFLIEALL